MKTPLATKGNTHSHVLHDAVRVSLLSLLLLCIDLPKSSAEPYVSAGNLRGETRFLEEEQCTTECCDVLRPCAAEETNPFTQTPVAFQIILIIFLILMSAFFSGLTLGLMGLDKTGLEIVMEGDDPKHAAHAAKIYPIRKRGNLLLCTLLLGNVCVNSLLSILTADKFGGAVGLVSSTFLIVIFGEIVPQALCQRYSLEVGSAAVPLVRVIIVLLYPVAFPLSYALDKALGEELATTYSNAEMLKLVQIHVEEEVIDPETATTMKGALNYKSTTVKEVMTPLENTFMLSSDGQLDFETIAKIFKTGYSRIPVYHINKNNVIGLLFVKDLIFIDPEDNTRVSDFVDIFGRGLHVVWPDATLGDVLRELKSGKSHMALVRDVNNEDESQDPYYEIKGIITLEDIIEEILGEEIVDETDTFLDGSHSVTVDRAEGFKWASLRLLDSKIVDERLSFEETKAVTAHLSRNFPAIFSLLTEAQLQRLILETPVSVLPTAEQQVGEDLPHDLLYQRHSENDVCTLVLSGKLTVIAGQDNFRSDVSSWSLLAGGALVNSPYKPDFSAWVSAGPCRCLRIKRARFAAAIDASILERQDPSYTSPQPKQATTSMLSSSEHGTPATSDGTPSTTGKDATESKKRKVKFMTALKAVDSTNRFGRRSGMGVAGRLQEQTANKGSNKTTDDSPGVVAKTSAKAKEVAKVKEETTSTTVQSELEVVFEKEAEHKSGDATDPKLEDDEY